MTGQGESPPPGHTGELLPLSRTLALPPVAAAAGQARAFLRDVLTAADRRSWCDTAELACTELVTNAVLHAHTDLEIRVEVRDIELLVEVRDGNSFLPVQRTYDSYATTGRGMALVAALTSEHGIRDAGPEGKTAWFVLRGDHDDRDESDLLAAWDEATWDDVEPATPAGPPHAPGPAAGRVRLLGLPPTLWLAAREHHDAILRELVLYLVDHDVDGVDPVAADTARATVSTTLWAALSGQDRAGLQRPARRAEGPVADVPDVLDPIDLVLDVPLASVAAFPLLQDTLDAAERLAISGALLARAGLPEIVAVRDWACEQVISQHSGAPPSPWAGMAQPAFTEPRPGATDDQDQELGLVRASDVGVVAADDSNRILAVSRPVAELLGWEPDDLVGRRIVTLVPARFREAHVAGFTRHLVTGEAHILDVPLVLPVMRADGTEILCDVVIHPTPDARPHRGRWVARISERAAGA